MQRKLLISLITLLIVVSLFGKWMRYAPKEHNMQQIVHQKLIAHMQSQGFAFKTTKPLNSSGTYLTYYFTHENCAKSVKLAPLMENATGEQILRPRKNWTLYYKATAYDAFPSLTYIFNEAIHSWLNDDHFPAVLAVYNQTNCTFKLPR